MKNEKEKEKEIEKVNEMVKTENIKERQNMIKKKKKIIIIIIIIIKNLYITIK